MAESDQIENRDKWAIQHKKEILSWGNDGIEYLLHYPMESMDYEKKRETLHAIIACLDIFGKKALPQLKKTMDAPFDTPFQIAVEAYFKLVKKFPEEGEYILKKRADWHPTDINKALYTWVFLQDSGLIWREEDQQKILDHFSQNFSEGKKDPGFPSDTIFWGNWSHIDDMLESDTIPFLSYLVLEFFKKEEGICFSTFYRVFDDIAINYPDLKKLTQSILPEQKDNNSKLLRILYNNDPRMFPHVLEDIYDAWTDINLFKLFPLDRDGEAIAFLKNYLHTKRDFKWMDAACILANYLTKDECAVLARELKEKDEQKRGDYLVELSETGCSVFEETVDNRRWGKVFLPDLRSRMPDYRDINKDLLRFLKGKIYRFKETICSEGEVCISRLKDLVETGSVLKQITALEWLSLFAEVNNDFFMEKLKHHKNAWIKAVCLWILKKRNADIPVQVIRESLHSKNPFLVFLGVGLADRLDKSDLEKLLERLFIEGDTIYQKEVLKKIHECFGYQKVKTCIGKPRKGINSILADIFFLQKAFENRDIKVLTGYFHPDSPPELLCPAAAALFELDKEKTVKKIKSFLTGGLAYLREKTRQKKLTEKGFETIVKTFISILGQSKNKHDIPILTKFYKTEDFEWVSRAALLDFIPILEPAELEELKENLHPYTIYRSMIERLNPKNQNWVYNYFRKNPQHAPIELIIERGIKPLFPIIRPRILKKGLYQYSDEIKKLNPGWAIQEFLWYLENGDRGVALTALNRLAEFPPSEKVDAIMKQKFLGSNEDEKEAACKYFARQGKDFVFPYLKEKINHPKEIEYFIDYLKYYPDQKGLKLVMELIENRVYRVWLDLDTILKEFTGKIPDQLKQYIYHPDFEVRKKIIAAFRGCPAVENWEELKQLIKHPDISLAIWAFDTYKDHLETGDFSLLTSFYQRLKSDSIKIEILEVISTFKSGEAAEFLREKSKTEKYIAEYAEYYWSLHDAGSLVIFLKQTTRPDLFKSALDRLIKIDKTKGMDMVLDLYINFDKEVSRFRSEKEKKSFLEEISKVSKVSPRSPVTKKKPGPIKKVVFTREITLPRRKNTRVRNCRTYLVGKTFFCFWQEEPDPLFSKAPQICRIIFSEDMQKWSSPITFTEPLRIKPHSILACGGGSYLLVYSRYPADANIHFYGLIPFFVPFDKKNGFKKGFYPLKNQPFFYDVFYFKGNYYIAGVPKNRSKSQKNRFEIYRSSSLENWHEKPVPVQLTEEKEPFSPTFTVVNDRVYMINRENLYESTDGFQWKRICQLPEFGFVQLLKAEENRFCAVLGSGKYGSYELYVTFSSDLIQWSPPLYTGLPVGENYAFHEKNLLELDETKIKAINLKVLDKDSDNDGLKDIEEEVLLTDANNPDTDGDGVHDLKDFDPIRKSIKNPTETMRVREAVIKNFFSEKWVSTPGDLLIIVSESDETQTFNNPKYRVLSFSPAEFERYVDRFSHQKDFYSIRFDKIKFSPDKRSAEVEFSYFPTSFTGDGHRMRLRKINNQWVVVTHEGTWIS